MLMLYIPLNTYFIDVIDIVYIKTSSTIYFSNLDYKSALIVL